MLLGLDLGTTNVKALVTDFTGRRLGEGSCAVRLYHVENGGVEQDIEEVWQATLAAIQKAVASIAPSDIQALGVSSQGGAMQMLNRQEEPVGRVLSWLDQRGAPFNEALTAELGQQWFRERIGHDRANLAIGQLLRLRQVNPRLVAAPNRVGFVGDIIVRRLCGVAGQDGTSCALTCLYNPERRDYEPDVLERLGMAVDQLPALVSSRKPVSGLRPEVARETGLRANIPVTAAIHDQYASALATGAVEAGTAMVGTGTAWVLLAVTESFAGPAAEVAFVCHHVVEGLWGQIMSLPNAGSALGRALKLTGQERTSAAEMDRLLQSAPAGSAGQVVRTVLEELGHALARNIALLRNAGLPINRLVLGGPSAASRVIPQILGAVTGLPIACSNGRGGSPLGAAILARGLLEPRRSLAEIWKEMAPASHPVEAGASASSQQEELRRAVQTAPLSQPG